MSMAGERTLSSALLQLLPEPVWDDLYARMRRRAYEPGDVIVRQGELEPDFHVIVEGTAVVRASTPRGEQRELGRLGFGECIGEMSLLTGEPASAEVVASASAATCSISQKELSGLGELRTALIESLSAILAGRLRRANERLLAKQAANAHVICCAADALRVLAPLGEAIARTTGGKVLTMIAGDALKETASGLAALLPGAQLLTDGDIEELPALLIAAGRNYDDVLILSDERGLHRIAADATSMLHVMRDDGAQMTPSAHASLGQVIAISPVAWTVPGLRDLSQRAGRPVVAAIPERGDADAGAALAHLARLLTGRTVGIALGAGAAKGLGHLGVLRAIAEMGVPIDAIAGCSIGAAVAAGFAAGMSIDELTASTLRAAKRAIRPTVPARSFLSMAGVRDELKQLAGDLGIEDLNIPTAIVATDLFRRSEINFTSGMLWPRVLASMAIPGVYAPVPGLGSYLVDGGVLNPVPVRQCRELGVGIVIGVRLTATRTSPRDQLDHKPGNPYAIETIMRTFEIMLNRISEVSHEHADVNIEVSIDGTGGVRDFRRGPEIAEAGYRAAWEASAQIAELLPYARGRAAA